MTANELLQQAGISHAVYLERLKTSEVNRIISLLNAIDRDLVTRIATKAGDTFTKARLEALLRDIRVINAEAVAELNIGLRDGMKQLAVYESDFQARKVQESIPIQWNITQPSPSLLHAVVFDRPFANALFAQHIKNIEGRRLSLIEGAIRMGVAEGESIAQIVRRIRGTRAAGYADGILEQSRREIASLVRTAVNHTVTTAREEMYDQNSDLIKGVQYVATLDSRTTLTCASLDGKVFPMHEGPRPPQHWGCRSTTIPVTKSWRELGISLREAPDGTRASMNGQVAASTTFRTWLRKQPASVQRDVLGAKRYDLYREGMEIDRFVRDGRVLTLKELERREKTAA
ncbi:MAG: minor capsid protein [Alkalispirochaeta sp.]